MRARKEETGARGEFLVRRSTSLPPGPETTKSFFFFRIARCLDTPFAVKIEARCAGMSLVWLHVGYLCATTKEAAFSTAIASRADFPFSGGVQRKV